MGVKLTGRASKKSRDTNKSLSMLRLQIWENAVKTHAGVLLSLLMELKHVSDASAKAVIYTTKQPANEKNVLLILQSGIMLLTLL
jgi:hypothetical protein